MKKGRRICRNIVPEEPGKGDGEAAAVRHTKYE